MQDLGKLNDAQIIQLINNRWNDSSTVWDIILKTWEKNAKIYQNNPEWLDNIPANQSKVRNNRIFRDMESVITSLLTNLPKPNAIPGHDTPGAKELAKTIVTILQDKYDKNRTRATLRRALRGLYLSRLFSLKVFWDGEKDDFDTTWVDPRKVRVSKRATTEDESEFAIEEVETTVPTLLERFKDNKNVVLQATGYAQSEEGEIQSYLQNKEITYQECWIGDWFVCKYNNYIFKKSRNPYWDWKGLLINDEEAKRLMNADTTGQVRADLLLSIKSDQINRIAAEQLKTNQDQEAVAGNDEKQTQPATSYKTYFYNHFDKPRKPYIFGTLFAVENQPMGMTDLISQAAPLQEAVDERKRQIAQNTKIVNGVTLVDSDTMTQEEANKLRYKPMSIIWGKGVTTGVKRVFGTPLPEFIARDMEDSKNEIDNLMGASAAFRGQREGQETKAGRIALIDQSFLQSNEIVQLLNEICFDLFNWWFQLMRIRYTEYHYTKAEGKEGALEVTKLMRDEIDDGIQIQIIPGKSLPQDAQFKFEQAQNDLKLGVISKVDYLEETGRDDAKRLAKNVLIEKMNPAASVGMTPEEQAALMPPVSSTLPNNLPPNQ